MQLSDVEVRILGALVEKESVTPDNYPLSLNALLNACNQSSNRDPVMELTEDAVRWAVNNLRQQSLVRAIQPSDSRVMKFQHLMREKLELEGAELAVMCVLMLRGPQTLGEIKGRTGRLADFTSIDAVESNVRALAARELVAEMPRRRGQKEARYTHLLSRMPADAGHADESEAMPAVAPIVARIDAREERIAGLEATVEQLRSELAELRAAFEEFRRQFS